MQPMDKGPRRKDMRRAMACERDTRAADGGPMYGPADMTATESAQWSASYHAGYRQGRSDYVRGAYAVPESASDGYRDGYARGYHWTRMHGMPSVALVAS